MASREEEIIEIAEERGTLRERRRAIDERLAVLEKRLKELLSRIQLDPEMLAPPVVVDNGSAKVSLDPYSLVGRIASVIETEPTRVFATAEIAERLGKPLDLVRATLGRMAREDGEIPKLVQRMGKGQFKSVRPSAKAKTTRAVGPELHAEIMDLFRGAPSVALTAPEVALQIDEVDVRRVEAALAALNEAHSIVVVPGRRGTYRLPKEPTSIIDEVGNF